MAAATHHRMVCCSTGKFGDKRVHPPLNRSSRTCPFVVAKLRAVLVVGLMWLMPWAVHAQPLTLDHQGRGLFSPVLEGAVHPRLTVSLDATTVRRRVATIDFERLQRARESISESRRPTVHSESSSHLPARRPASSASDTTLSLNLFEDVELTGIVESTEPTFSGGYSMSGHLVGESPGTLTFVVNGEMVAGAVRTLAGTYRIHSAGDGLYTISEVEETPLECEVLDR